MRTVVFFCWISLAAAAPQNTGAGRALFDNRCASCHGGDGNGGAFGPAIVASLGTRNDVELASFVRSGAPGRGMPAFNLTDGEMRDLIVYLRSLRPQRTGPRTPVRMKLDTTIGGAIEGVVLGEGIEDLQVRSDD